MKLASLKNQSRDGQLVVVSRDLTKAVAVPHIAATMQYALDHWSVAAPKLTEVYQGLNHGIAGVLQGGGEAQAHLAAALGCPSG